MIVMSPLPLGPMGFLASLEGTQPLMMKRLVGPKVDRRSLVFVAECLKLVISLTLAPGGAATDFQVRRRPFVLLVSELAWEGAVVSQVSRSEGRTTSSERGTTRSGRETTSSEVGYAQCGPAPL